MLECEKRKRNCPTIKIGWTLKILTRKKIVKKKVGGMVGIVTTKRYGLHLLAGATNNRSLSEANGREWLVAQHKGGRLVPRDSYP